ncbi:AsnC family protein [Limnobacter sp.]
MNELDAALLGLLIKDSRLSFADIARQTHSMCPCTGLWALPQPLAW